MSIEIPLNKMRAKVPCGIIAEGHGGGDQQKRLPGPVRVKLWIIVAFSPTQERAFPCNILEFQSSSPWC
jgi:hypothetical protein